MNSSVKNLIRIFLSLLIIFIFIQITVSYYYYNDNKKELLTKSLKEELKLKRKMFSEHFIKQSEDFIFAVKEDTAFKKYIHGDKKYKKELKNLFLALANSHKYIDQIRYIDSQGMEKVRINHDRNLNTTYIVKDEELQDKSNRYYFERSYYSQPNEIWFSQLDLNIENNIVSFPYKPTIRAVLPLEYNSNFKGILVFNFNISDLIKDLLKSKIFKFILINKKQEILVHYNSNYNWSSYKKNNILLKDILPNDEINILTNFEYTTETLSSIYICNQIQDSLILIGQIKNEYLKNLKKEYIEKTILIIFSISFIFITLAIITRKRLIEILTILKKTDEENINLSQTLELTEEKWKAAIEDSGDGHWDWNLLTDEVNFSKNWKSMIGYKEDEISNNFFEWEKRLHKDDIERIKIEVNNLLTIKSYRYKVKFRMKTKDNKYKWIYGQAYILNRDENDKPVRIIGTHRDITNEMNKEELLKEEVRKKTDENFKQFQLIQQQSKLAAMGEMIGAIAHQWRQPLNEVSIRIQKLKYAYKDGKIDEDFIQSFIEKNKKTISFMSQTIDDFRHFFIIDKTPSKFSVNDSIQNVLSLLDSQLNKSNIHINVIEENNFEIEGFKSEFEHVIMNLISNSKYEFEKRKTKKPQILIYIQKGLIEFEDNAGGIDSSIIDRVFEPYFTNKDQGEGTGMGLYMSKIIIEDNMKGTLNVTSSSIGAKFTIKLNMKDIDA